MTRRSEITPGHCNSPWAHSQAQTAERAFRGVGGDAARAVRKVGGIRKDEKRNRPALRRVRASCRRATRNLSWMSRFLVVALPLLLWLASTTLVATSKTFSHRVAVCVSGQLARWFPEHLADGLLAPNPEIDFSVFANIQHHTRSHSWIYNTDSHIAFHPTNLSNMAHAEVLDHVHSLYDRANSRLVSVTYAAPMTVDYWKKLLDSQLDRIVQYKSTQHTILNMYSHHEACMEQIGKYEARHNFLFDAVLSTREDIYYFRPLNLTALLVMTEAAGHGGFSSCDIITKDCLSWGGIHMRWQLATRNASENFFAKRIVFYRHLLASNKTTYNPEMYEKAQVDHYKLKVCEVKVDYIPNVVVRHVKDGATCFLKPEIIDHCIPDVNGTYVYTHMCQYMPAQYRVKPGKG